MTDLRLRLLPALLAAACAGKPSSAPPPIAPGAPPAISPFGGKPHPIPGVVEAERYDDGAAEIAYHDVDPKNHGAPLRGETQVDIEARPDASGGHGIGWTKAGEWLLYTVEVAGAGSYAVEIPVASKGPGGTFHLEFDGTDRSGPIQVPDTGAWTKLDTITKGGIRLAAGRQVMRVVMDSEGSTKSIGDMDLFRFRKE